MAAPNDIILYHYSFSPYARRITWYLALRGIDYAQCHQPPILPRPDLTSLGIVYRRIPVMAIGKDIYCDTRLILIELDRRFPCSTLSATTPEHQALSALLEKWIIEGDIFNRASQLIPAETPILQDARFTKDREDLTGRSWNVEDMARNRGEALVVMMAAFDFLEKGLLKDGREWILNTQAPSLADIEAVWPFHWLTTLKGALPPPLISATQYPRTYAWIDRFAAAAKSAAASSPKPTTLTGPAAFAHVTAASFGGEEAEVDASDPLALQKGQMVEVWPTDSGSGHKERGTLVGLGRTESVCEVAGKEGKVVRVHCPRAGFRIRAVGGEARL